MITMPAARLSASWCPRRKVLTTPRAPAKKAVNTSVKPATNSSVLLSTWTRAAASDCSVSCAALRPDISET